jgi:hypothetical protein
MVAVSVPASYAATDTSASSTVTAQANYASATKIVLSDTDITVDGSSASSDSADAVYLSHDIIYYEDKDSYESGNPYGEGTAAERHTESEALAHTVVNISQPGTYIISGTLSKGQIAIDLGKDAKTNPDAVVTLVLDNANITCDVAPAVIFYNVYECDSAWVAYDEGETSDFTASSEVDTSAAGANVIIADGSINNITGSHVARIYKDNDQKKKRYKYDGAFYSCMSMNINSEALGTGILNIVADNEGLDSELHLTINGGKVYIQSQDDGINTNEDGVSVTTINGGELHIVAGLGSEGDGVDSNGYLVINGGVVISIAKPTSDSGLDSDMGSYINGGYVVATGSTMDWAESDSNQVTMNLQFASSQDADEAIIVTDTSGKVIFAYDPDKDETTGSYNRGYQGAVISCPEFKTGDTYYVYVGGDVTGTETNGLYDASTVTGFTGAVRQEYTGTDVGMGGPGGFGGQKPDGENGQPPELPDGTTFDPSNTDRPERPDGDNGQQFERPDGTGSDADRPEKPDGENGQPPELPDGMTGWNNNQTGNSATSSVRFYMTDKVNAFSGVTDEGTNKKNEEANSSNENNPSETVLGFTDISATGWYYSGVEYAVKNNLFNGTSKTTFEPNTAMTRAMLWTVLARMDGTEMAASTGSSWYAAGQSWAQSSGISDGTLPSASITREQLVTMLWRYAGSPESTGSLDGYTDAGSVSAYASEAMSWAVSKGLISGTTTTTLSPGSSASRAQVATLLQRYADLISGADK